MQNSENKMNEEAVRLLYERRAERWRRATQETGADKLGEVRARLLLWRSGRGINSRVIDVARGPVELAEAIWRMNESFEEIMSIEGARVNVPAPVPVGLAKEIRPGIDTAGLYIWDGFVFAGKDEWSGLLWEAKATASPLRIWSAGHTLRLPDPELDDELRSVLSAHKRDKC